MICRNMGCKWAMPIMMMVGMAFFLTGCPPKTITEKGTLPSEESATALRRAAEAYLNSGQYPEALNTLQRLEDRFPDYGNRDVVAFQVAKSLYLMGAYERSKDKAIQWLAQYPQHSLRVEVMLLAGENMKALGFFPEAFLWWYRARDACLNDPQLQEHIHEKLLALINDMDTDEIEELSGHSIKGDYIPGAYYKRATDFLQQNELEKAYKAAMALVRSSAEPLWIARGRDLLEKIQGQMSVKMGVVGCLLPLSGPFAFFGEEVLSGIQLGIGMTPVDASGPSIELVIKDTKGTPEDALAGLEELDQDENVMAVVGPLSSRTAVPVAQRAQDLGLPMIAFTQKGGITEQGDMVFRNFLTPQQEVQVLVKTAVDDMGMKRFAILYPDNSYGHFVMNLFWDSLEEKGGVVCAVESYQTEVTDFADQIKKTVGLYYPRPDSLIRKLREMRSPEEEECELEPDKPKPIIDFDAIFIPDTYQRVAMIAPQLAYHDITHVQLLGTSLWQSPKLLDTAGDYVQDAIFPSGFLEGSGMPGVESFVERYKANFDASPGILAATGYDTIGFLKAVMGAGEIHTRKDLQKALLAFKGFTGVTGRVSFDEQGEVEKVPLLLTISGRRLTLLN